MATWPSTLSISKNGYTEQPPDRVLRTQMEAGVDKTRRRTTNASREIEFKMTLTDAEVATLDAFFLANDGVVFDFDDLRTGNTFEARFRSAPKYAYNQTVWDVEVQLELLP